MAYRSVPVHQMSLIRCIYVVTLRWAISVECCAWRSDDSSLAFQQCGAVMSVRIRNVENVQELLQLNHSMAEVSLELDDTDRITGGDSAVAKLRRESQQQRVNNKGGDNDIFSLLFGLIDPV